MQRQIQNLRRTRDLLLPRLLSGQVTSNQLNHEHEQKLKQTEARAVERSMKHEAANLLPGSPKRRI